MTHTWKIYDLKRTIAEGVVTEVTWACESESEGYSTRQLGNLTITGNASDEGFIPFEDLTEANVLSWVNANINQDAISTQNADDIASMKAAAEAVTEVQGLPW